jgi:hypothetical protein
MKKKRNRKLKKADHAATGKDAPGKKKKGGCCK